MNKPTPVIREFVEVTQKAIDDLSRSSGSTTQRVISRYYDTLKRVARKIDALSEEGIVSIDDVSAIESQVDDVQEISTRRLHRDVRSFEHHTIQGQDAVIALESIKRYWENTDLGSLKGMDTPNYRFKIGADVVLKSNTKRSGKVVGVEKENGTGRQIFLVKLFDADQPKRYPSAELKRFEKIEKN